jgi:quinol monooxygenase YgiN
MSITRINEFRAREGETSALAELLRGVAQSIQNNSGCLACRFLQAIDDPQRIVILEEWESVDAHRAALARMAPADFEPVMRLLESRPSGAYFQS